MAVRYSGDAEVRIAYRSATRTYVGMVRDPFFRWSGSAKPRLGFLRRPTSPEAYDDAAVTMLLAADKASGRKLLLQAEGGRVRVRRLFQAPCPIGPPPRIAKKKKTRANVAPRRKKRHRR